MQSESAASLLCTEGSVEKDQWGFVLHTLVLLTGGCTCREMRLSACLLAVSAALQDTKGNLS